MIVPTVGAGWLALMVTTVLAVAVQPLAAVTVTVYVLEVVKVLAAVVGVLPPFQA